MLIFCIFLFFISVTRSNNNTPEFYANLPKCCDVESVFVKENDSFLCNRSESARVDIQTDLVNMVLDNTTAYQCVEIVEKKLFLFNRTLHNALVIENISKNIVPKCCPRGDFYNPVTYSCEENFNENTINDTFLKIGLPECQIIYDYRFQNKDDIFVSKFWEKFGRDKYCIDATTNSEFVVRACETIDICKRVQCIHKCCPDGQSFVNGSFCKDTYVYGLDLRKFSSVIDASAGRAIIHGFKTKLYIANKLNYRIDFHGNFHTIPEELGNENYPPEEETYCIEHATKNGYKYGHVLFRVYPSTTNYMKKKFFYNRPAMVISNVFLLLTVAYYIYSKETRKVFGKTLVSFCAALFTLFSILTYCTFQPNMRAESSAANCKTIGFVLIYFCFSCFVWLQVMCYDIYWTFGSSKRYSSSNNRKRRDLKRFICYTLYGWGVPLIVILVLITFHFTDVLPPSIKIKVGETKCLIERGEDNYAEILFYIIPMTMIQTVNLVFFIKTVKYCLQVKGNIQKMNQSSEIQKKKNKFRARKERFGLVIKLSFVMGFFYLFEVVSSIYDFQQNVITEYIEIIWDCINCLQGFFIFVIFVCKMKYITKWCTRKAAFERIRKISNATSTRTTAASGRDSKRKYSTEEAKNNFG